MIRTIASAAVVAAALALSTAAFAASGNGNGQGNQGCLLSKTTTVYANPGKMFQAIRAIADGAGNTGDNPKQWIESYPGYAANNNVGDFIYRNCVTANPAP